MKKVFVAIFAASALLLAGCAKTENAAPVATGRTVRITADTDVLESKVVSSVKGRFTWQKNDVIGVWTGAGITPFVLDDNWAGFGHGEFVGELPEGGVIDENSYAVYPYVEEAEATATSYTFPAASKWGIPETNYMLYGKGDGTVKDGVVANFTFHHTTAYFRVTIKNIRTACNGLFIESAGPCFALGAKVDFSRTEPAIEYTAKDENIIYEIPAHTAATDVTLIIPMMSGRYEQQWGKGGLKFRIACYSEPNWWSTKFDDAVGFFGEGTGYDIAVGEYYVFPEIKCANAKNADDSGSGVNDGIEDTIVITQDPDGFWTNY
ncbi:MAG: hypothetical protein IJU21_06135 [Bacteroidales bacterium]|nr:hypothetical protein [Bacteroidales bacterium]